MNESLDFIYKQQKELSTLGSIAALLGWDQLTYMPPMGASERSEQTALISKLGHKRVVSEDFWKHINNLSKESVFENLADEDRNVVRRLREDVEKSRKVPTEFVEKMSRVTTLSYQAWEEARKKNDFKIFSTHLEKIVNLEKEYCGFINLSGPLYNSLLDDYEEGMTVDRLNSEFNFLKPRLIKILNRIKSSRNYENQKKIDIKFSKDQQKMLCEMIMNKMQLTNKKSRLDVSTHPFSTSIGYDDVRLTTSFERKEPFFSFFSTVHEAGHSLYELGMPVGKYKDTVISDSPSFGLHESQSRFWENMICRNLSFWKFFYPVFKEISPEQFKNIDLENWYKLINQVRPSLIRVEADELTYGLHVILRFELELGLMEDEIKVSELPDLWNQKMDEMLGITPENDVDGVLQDMHWSGGSFGYFPSYAIGTIYSSQLFKQLDSDMPSIYSDIENGDFTNILNWLRENVHQYGRVLTADEIISNCCGVGLNSKTYVEYLENKYYQIYEA